MIQETFGALLRDRAHWEFELFLMLIFDGLLAGLLTLVATPATRAQVAPSAAEMRAYRSPEPYKGKGVRYSDETVVLKETKKK